MSRYAEHVLLGWVVLFKVCARQLVIARGCYSLRYVIRRSKVSVNMHVKHALIETGIAIHPSKRKVR
jgi:hypothetical protein